MIRCRVERSSAWERPELPGKDSDLNATVSVADCTGALGLTAS